jgi:hypothetical protein
LRELEHASGRQSHDIRLTNEIHRLLQEKLAELQLDPHDTTGKELYAVLGERLKRDEELVSRAIQTQKAGTDDPIAQVAATLRHLPIPKRSFALKTTVAKRMLKTLAPKKTMKTLGYRSLDSMLKHEPTASLYAAAWLLETEAWRKRLVSGYTKLEAKDFEVRDISFEHPTTARWQALSDTVVAQQRHHVLAFKELGAVVLLPLPSERPPLATLTSLVFGLHGLNEVHASGIYLQLHQVKGQFGRQVQAVVTESPIIASSLLDKAVPWSLAQRYFARYGQLLKTEIFEPHVQLGDIMWHPVESVLASIEPALAFWQNTAHLGLLHDGQPVSCNLTDSLLSHCNKLPYQKRLSHNMQESLWNELQLRYLNYDKLEQSIADSLSLHPVTETALA